MPLRSSPERWGVIAQTLHWSVAVLVLVLLALGLWMTDLPNTPFKVRVYALHKSLGLIVLALMLLRLLWRCIDRRPPLPPTMPRWQRHLAHLSHGLLYVLLLVLPLSGWIYNSASNFPLRWFGLIALPKLVAPDPALKALSHTVHEVSAWVLLAVLSLHVLAALKHHFIDRDPTLVRMLPSQCSSRRPKEPA